MASADAFAARRPLRRSLVPFAASRDTQGYLFLLPWLAGFFLLTAGPTLASLYLSFTSFDLVRNPRWIGAANYVRIATDDVKFVDSLKVTFLYVALAVPLKLAFALVV